ncbi:MAG: SsrA-binding protein SmpB [Anaerolineae bacterium]|jgi:SsrA-binding protein|nr:SsrA-binding protein SmpB [Anaerolineae bacterium]
MGKKIIATNRKARFEYFLLEDFEAGISLKGSEIKSIRAGQISIAEAYIQIDENQAWLINAHIAPYDPASRENHDPKRKRQLLLHRKEIWQIWQSIRSKGLTVIPTEIYLKDGRAKVNISLAKGKKLYDKRQEIAKKDYQRELERERRR